MSLQQFLAVGRSFASSPREKSPFEMRKDTRLPTFENSRRFAARPSLPIQTDWLEEKRPATAPSEPFMPAPRNPVARKARRKRSWLEIFTFGLFGKPKLSAELFQDEMQLENVRVMRNDLEDADLEVVVKKGRKFALKKVPVTLPEPAPEEARKEAPPAKLSKPSTKRGEWTELTARLFEIGQH